ncbi:MAG: hypothetical protein U1F43_16965 [Myxococcota bacterium]
MRLARALREAGRGRDAARVEGELARSAPTPEERRAHLRAAVDALMVVGAIDEGLAIARDIGAELGLDLGSSGAARALRLAGGALRILLDPTASGQPRRGPGDARARERCDTLWPVARALVFIDPLVGVDAMLRALGEARASGDARRVKRVTGPIAGFLLGTIPGFKATARRWVDALDDEAARLLWSSYLCGTQGDLIGSLAAGRAAMERLADAPDAGWERLQAISIVARGLFGRGHFATLRALVNAHLPDAERQANLYAMATLTSYLLLPTLTAGRVEEARGLARWTHATWLPGRFSPISFYADRCLRLADAYEGRAASAAADIAAGRDAFAKAGGYRIVISRFDHDLMEARIALALTAPVAGLWPVAKLLDRLAKLALPEGPAHAELLRASVAARDGRREAALGALGRAIAMLEHIGVDLEAQVGRLRQAQLRGEAAPAEAARAALRQLGVRDPDRWAEVVAPGYAALT